ncbi:MAG: ankyrin repeat domain-containing protein [Granulosicoccaceae bacterium]
MKLLIILLAMVAVGAGSLHSYHERNLYVQAALLSEAYTLIAPVKRQISDHYVRHGIMPHDNTDAGLPPAQSIFGASVMRVAINRGGVLLVDFEEEIGEQTLTFSPSINSASGLLDWRCSSDSIDSRVLEKLKPSCTYLPGTPSSQLMHAIANRSLPTVKTLLLDGADADVVVNGNTPLMLAAKMGDSAIVELLLDSAAIVDNNAVNAERRTPLMVAITSNNADVAALLLSRGASTSRIDYRGLTPHDHAVETDRRLGGQRYVLMVAARLNPGFAGRHQFGTNARSAARPEDMQALYANLRNTAKECNTYRLASLLSAQNDFNASELIDGKPITGHKSKPECGTALLEFLQTRKSYQQAMNSRFADAMQACDVRRVEQILKDNATLNVFREVGHKSHFSRAVTAGCSDVVTMLTRKQLIGGKLEDDILITAIRHAPQVKLVELVGVLITAGANVNAIGNNGETGLSLAIALEQPVVAKFLVDADADVNHVTDNQSYPIIEASKKGLEHLVSQLIQRGADVDQQDQLGRTALVSAVAQGQNRIVNTLLGAGADVRQKDQNGISALTLAESKNLGHIHSLLTASTEY